MNENLNENVCVKANENSNIQIRDSKSKQIEKNEEDGSVNFEFILPSCKLLFGINTNTYINCLFDNIKYLVQDGE